MKNYTRILWIVLLLLLGANGLVDAQVGRTFWFVAPDVTVSHSGDGPYALRITAGATATRVKISWPANNATWPPIYRDVAANSQITIDTNNGLGSTNKIENSPLNTINKKGILIEVVNLTDGTAGSDITCYFEVTNSDNPDIFTLKGENALGVDFYVPSQNSYPNNQLTVQPKEQVNIVATENDTEVTITPKIKITASGSNPGTAGVPFKIILDKGETYSFEAENWASTSLNLGGTHITSDKKVAVTVSDDSIEQYAPGAGTQESYDLIGDQIVPTSIIGNEYIAVKASNDANNVNKVYITATDKATTVEINGGASNSANGGFNVNLNAGETKLVDFPTGSSAIQIVSLSNPIYVYQVSGVQKIGKQTNEFGSMLLPTTSGCTGSKRVSFTRQWSEDFFVQIMTKQQNISKFKMYAGNSTTDDAALSSALNGNTTTPDNAWKKVGTSDWYTKSVNMRYAPYGISNSTYSIENVGLFHLSVMDYNGTSLSGGYFSSYNSVAIEGAIQACENNVNVLKAKDKSGDYTWTSNVPGFVTSKADTVIIKQSGTYYLTRDDNVGCTAVDSIAVVVKTPNFDLPPIDDVCPNVPITITLPPQYKYVWSTGETTNSITITPKFGEDIKVSVTGTDTDNCGKFDSTQYITYKTAPVSLTHIATIVCSGDTIKNLTKMASYTWYRDNIEMPAYKDKDYIIAQSSGTAPVVYRVEGKSTDGCVSTDSKTITVNPLPVVDITDQFVCFNAPVTYTLTPVAGQTYRWETPTGPAGNSYTANAIAGQNPRKVWVQSALNGCIAKDSALINYRAEQKVSLSYFIGGGATSVALDEIFTCAENAVTLTALPSTFTSYTWTIPGQTPAPGALQIVPIAANGSKFVKVLAADANGCIAKDSVTIKGYPTQTMTTNKPAYCFGETMSITTAFSSYQWIRKSDNVTVNTGSSYVASAPGVYIVRGLDNNGCASTSIEVTVHALPVVGLSGPKVCEGAPFVFTGSPSTGVNYLWSQPSEPAEVKSYTGLTFSVTADAPTFLEVEDQITKCKATASAMPDWHDAPTADISYNNTFLGTVVSGDDIYVCPSTTVTLAGTATSTSGTTFNYEWYVNTINQNSNTPTIPIPGLAPNTSKVIRLKVTDINGCTAEDNITLRALSDPNNVAWGNDEICKGQDLSVASFSSTISSVNWTFNSLVISTQYTITPQNEGSYTANIINTNGCAATHSYQMHDPAITLTNTDDDVLLCATVPFQTFGVVTKPNYTYQWTSLNPVTSVTGPTFNATKAGTYVVTATRTPLGCTASMEVIVRQPPTKIVDLVGDLSVCASAAAPVAVNGDPTMTNYVWRFNGTIIPFENNSTYTIPYTGSYTAGTYTVEADYTDKGDVCRVVQSFNFVVKTVLDPLVFSNASTICELEELTLQGYAGFTSYKWYKMPDETTVIETLPKYKVTAGGEYKLVATQANGCETWNKIPVTVTPMPVFLLTPPTQSCQGEKIILDDQANSTTNNYEWIYNNKIVATTPVYHFEYEKSGDYSLKLISKANNACFVKTDWTHNTNVKPNFQMNDVTICDGITFDLNTVTGTLTSISTTDYSYDNHVWLDGTTMLPVVNPTSVTVEGKYIVRATFNYSNGHICTFDYPFNLNVVTLPNFASLVTSYSICSGKTAELDGTGVSPTQSYLTYDWTFTGATPNGAVVSSAFPHTRKIIVSDAGYYNVRAWVNEGTTTCSSTSNPINVAVNANPIITITPDKPYLCVGKSVILTASSNLGTTNYVWNNNPGTTGSVLNINTAGTYSVEGTVVATSCKSIMVANVANHTPTDVVLAPFAPICNGQPFTLPALPAGTATSYQWFYNNTGNPTQGVVNSSWTPNPAPTVNTNYALSYTIDGCPIEKIYEAIVYQNPAVTLTTPPAPFCDGDITILDAGVASGSVAYQWTRLPATVVGNAQTYPARTSGTYQVDARSSQGCTTTKNAAVTFNANPIITLGNDTSACHNVTYALTAKSASALNRYTWSTGIKDDGKSSITTNKGGTYWVKAYNANNCFDMDSIDVSIYPITRVELPQLEPLCSNDSITLYSPLAVPAQISSYQWFYGAVGGTPQGKVLSPWTVKTPGQYALQVTDVYGCISSGTTSVAGIPAPNFSLGADRNGCVGDSLKIVAQNSYIRYMWNGNPNDNLWFKIADPAFTQYTLEVEDRNGCIATSSVNFVSKPLPIPFLGGDVTQCEGFSTTITPIGGPYKSILWSTGATTRSIDVGAGTYEVSVVDENGCVGKDLFTHIWLENPEPDLGPDEQICQNTDLILQTTEVYPTYSWQTGSIAQTILAQFADTLNTVEVTDNFGCIGRDDKLVYIKTSPDYIVSPDTALCSNYILVLDAGTEYPNILWSTGSTSDTINVSTSGDYWIEANNGCVWVQDTINVHFHERPLITALDTMIYAQINIEAEGGLEPYLYTLNQGTLQSSNAFKYLANGVYEAYVEDARKCWDIDSVAIYSVIDIDIPNFFTPNNDGHNDNWVVDGLQERFPDANIVVYDRYNREIIKLKGDGDGWDGTYLGKDMPSDDYWFVINLVHVNKTLKGNITLKR